MLATDSSILVGMTELAAGVWGQVQLRASFAEMRRVLSEALPEEAPEEKLREILAQLLTRRFIYVEDFKPD